MKQLYIFLLLVGCASCQNFPQKEPVTTEENQIPQEENNQPLPVIDFENKMIQLKVKQGEVAKDTFYFQNIGTGELLIAQVQSPCTCSTPIFKKEAILPQEKSYIVIQHNSEKKALGTYPQNIVVKSNTKAKFHKLTLEVKIVE